MSIVLGVHVCQSVLEECDGAVISNIMSVVKAVVVTTASKWYDPEWTPWEIIVAMAIISLADAPDGP